MSETHLYRVAGEYRFIGAATGRHHSFKVFATSPEHAEQRVRDFLDSEPGTVHKGIELESSDR